MDTTALGWSMFFGSFGLGYFVYGKKQGKAVPLLTGMALSIFPYFIEDVYILVAVGFILLAIPYFVRA